MSAAKHSNHTLRFPEEDGLIQTDPAALAEELEADAWSSLSAGEGAKGPRLHEGARLPMGFSKNDDVERWVLLRKSLRDPKALASYVVHAPKGTSLTEIAGAAGLRWTLEEGFPACSRIAAKVGPAMPDLRSFAPADRDFLRAKDDLGLDHCGWCDHRGWVRPLRGPILAWMASPHDPGPHELIWAAAAFLAKLAADQRRDAFGKPKNAILNPEAA